MLFQIYLYNLQRNNKFYFSTDVSACYICYSISGGRGHHYRLFQMFADISSYISWPMTQPHQPYVSAFLFRIKACSVAFRVSLYETGA